MSLYIVFNNFSSFPEMSEPVDSIEEIITAAADSVEKAGQDISAGGHAAIPAESQTDTVPKVDDHLENPLFVVSDKPAVVSARQVPPVVEINTEIPELAGVEQNPEIQTKNVGQNDIYQEFHTLLKKFEISLQYRYDFTDIFNSNKQTEDSQNSKNLIEKSLSKQRAVQEEDFERRFQEKQAESYREHLKQKKSAS